MATVLKVQFLDQHDQKTCQICKFLGLTHWGYVFLGLGPAIITPPCPPAPTQAQV